jgi:molybdopterin-containing oxidoreductase family membrane subunit
MKHTAAVLGIFAYHHELQAALQALKERNLDIRAVYSPVPLHAVEAALASRPSRVKYFTLAGAIIGIITGIFLSVYTSIQWSFMVSGKPIVSYVPMVIVAFEFCILLAIIFNLLGMLVSSRLPNLRMPRHYDPRFTADRFGILLHCEEAERAAVAEIMKQAGAEDVHDAV